MMKKISPILIIALILSIIPMATVQSQVEEATLVAIFCASDADNIFEWDGNPSERCDEFNVDPLTDTVTVSGDWYTDDGYKDVRPVYVRLDCTGTECEDDYKIYYKATINFSGYRLGSGFGFRVIPWAWDTWVTPGEIFYPCPTEPLYANCARTAYGIIPLGTNQLGLTHTHGSDEVPPGYNANITLAGVDAGTGNMSYSWEIILSLTPIDDGCGSAWQSVDDGVEYSIPVTAESGRSVLISDDKTYRLDVYGGPWNDGTNDRDDSAYSFDGSTWSMIGGLPGECSSFGEGSYSVIFDPPAGITDIHVRVNDTAGNFGDNTGTLSMRITEVNIRSDCESQYSYASGGTPIASGSISATSIGDNVATLTIGNYYVISTTGGHWHDDASPTELFTVAMRASNGVYTPLGSYTGSNCQVSVGSYTTVYFQAASADLYLSVYDSDGIMSDNTGAVNYTLYAATYTRTPQLCESLYTIGSLIETRYVTANMANGIELMTKGIIKPAEATGGGDMPAIYRWFALDVIGGPWKGASGAFSYQADITSDQSTWYNLASWPDAACVVPLDNLGRYRIFFPGAKEVTYNFRVDATSYTGNSGTLGYSLYEASDTSIYNPDPGNDPSVLEPDLCTDNFTTLDPITGLQADALWTGAVNSTNAAGVMMTGVTAGDLIEIVTYLGPWYNGSDPTPLYNLDISTDNGATWTPFLNYAGISCAQSADGNHMGVFMVAQAGRVYRFRVSDPGEIFTDNTGGLLVKAFKAWEDIDPWASCADNYPTMRTISLSGDYGYSPINPLTWNHDPQFAFNISVKSFTGDQLGAPLTGWYNVGSTYAVEIWGGPWYEADDTPSYIAALSSDNGTTWTPIGTGSGDCTVRTDNNHYLIYFTVAAGEIYRIRVNDENDLVDFLTNDGELKYYLYATIYDPTDYDPPDPGTGGPNWASTCSIRCTRPSSLIDIPAWLGYGFCSMQYYISWCPEHSAALSYVKNIFDQREPFATLMDVSSVIPYTMAEIDAYTWDATTLPDLNTLGTGGGDQPIVAPLGIFNGLPSDSPWMGGQIEYGSGSVSMGGTDLTSCNTALVAELGAADSKLPQGYCWVMNIAGMYGVIESILFIEIVGCVLYFWDYLQKRWLNKLRI
jgi:hypothetical protein